MLTIGQTFTLGGARWTVKHVNFSRAYCVTTRREAVTVRDTRRVGCRVEGWNPSSLSRGTPAPTERI